ncbi:hypothetical protein CEXT_711501 [Caerostris extrusa]|uniref:Uncharacterized protein n=1 Tax=Caerostris extrusa TaxID=172846 RepID=A0AAV4N2X8_CAEEX|nr:hypothetical protein CEXT_711501 [Caerostris extrusa]
MEMLLKEPVKDPSNATSYRPISLSKIVEFVLFSKTNSLIYTSNLKVAQQMGSTLNLSTILHLLRITEVISEAFMYKSITRVIYQWSLWPS